MLVLTRKREEAIVIDGQIVVTVLEIGRGRVRLGVIAPAQVSVFRGEIHERMQLEPAAEQVLAVEVA
jgi:carbon storage regulator